MPRLSPTLALSVMLAACLPALALDGSRAGPPAGPDLQNLDLGQVTVRGGLTVAGPGKPAGSAFITVHNPANTPQPDGVFIAPIGPTIDYCSVGGCFDGPHLRSHVLINTTTGAGADAQENALAINFTSKTGKVVRWRPHTAFTVGQNVRVFGSACRASVGGTVQVVPDCLYTPTTGGTTGTVPPTGNPTSHRDGSVVWAFLGAGAHDGKTALNVACTAEEGAGQTWCTNFNFSVRYKGAGTAWGEEKDCNNGNETSEAGSRFLMACTFYGGGGEGTWPFLAYQYVGSGAVNTKNPNPYGANSYIFISGQPNDVGSVVRSEVILDAGNSAATIRALPGRRHADGFLVDGSDSAVILKASGTHAKGGVDLQGAIFPEGNAILLPDTTFITWGRAAFLGKNAAIGAITLGPSNSGTAYSMAAWDNGDLSYGRHLWSRGSAPALASCGAGTLSPGATDDHGVVALPAGSKGCRITFAAARAQKPACTFWMTSGQLPAGSVAATAVTLAYAPVPDGTEIHYQCMGR
ncbi:hypothetical protein [Methylobacterium aquaticum]|uniref:Ig-like domain-containing protein n=1 Tax=Methylobacterium aquaticum TaxID=270351 RepID=A0A0J6SEP7_9HYPH|nr:hypothetical protein [Methylobacterium aquaticum]KMO33685.1 hypothetical protein VP06_15935 [Methylobacterium aquaticum]